MYETYAVSFRASDRIIIISLGHERARLPYPEDFEIGRCLDAALNWMADHGRHVISVLQLVHPGDLGPRSDYGWQFRVVTEPIPEVEEKPRGAKPHPGSRRMTA